MAATPILNIPSSSAPHQPYPPVKTELAGAGTARESKPQGAAPPILSSLPPAVDIPGLPLRQILPKNPKPGPQPAGFKAGMRPMQVRKQMQHSLDDAVVFSYYR